MATNSPSFTARFTLRSTSVRRSPSPYPLATPRSSTSAATSATLRRTQAILDHLHPPIQQQPHQSDGDDAQDDVLVDQAVVLLPEEAAHAGTAGQHLDRHDH